MKITAAFTLTIILTVPLFAQDSAYKQKLCGFWSKYYSIGDSFRGYVFSKDGAFYSSHRNYKNSYSGSMGVWRVVDKKIQIKTEYDRLWGRDEKIDPETGNLADEDVDVKLYKRENIKWETIGYINHLTEVSTFDLGNNNSFTIPGNIFLRTVDDNLAIGTALQPYWNICSCEEPESCRALNYVIEPFEDLERVE